MKTIKDIEYYDETMPIRIWFGNLAKYNEGNLVGAWLSLPMLEEDLKEAMSIILGDDEEYLLNDYESVIEGLDIGEYSDVFDLNEKAAILDEFDEYELDCIEFLLETICISFDEAIENRNEVIVFEGDIEELVDEYLEDGFFGEIPETIRPYIDKESIARVLEIDGYVYDREKNKVYFYGG